MVNYALDFLANEEVEFTLLNAYKEPDPGSSLLVNIKDILKHESEKGLEREKKRILKRFHIAEKKIITKSVNNNLTSVIHTLTKINHYDLAFMGSRGRSEIKSKIFGSNTIEMIRKTTIPLLIIPEYYVYKIPIKFGYGTDYKKLNDYSILDTVKEIVINHYSKLNIVNVHENTSPLADSTLAEEQTLEEVFKEIPHSFMDQDNHDVVKGLQFFIHEQRIDFLILIARKHSFLERLFHRSVTQELSQSIKVPLMVLKDESEI